MISSHYILENKATYNFWNKLGWPYAIQFNRVAS
jgi:hypothetical protein